MQGFRALPSVDQLLQSETGLGLIAEHGRAMVTRTARARLDLARAAIRQGADGAVEAARLPHLLAADLAAAAQSGLRPILNLTGTILHTNLGRAILAPEAIEAGATAMAAPVALEFDLRSGGRGQRDDHLRDLLCELTGADDATIVNNNAAAVLIALNTLARDREAIVSRGELIEIGGAFRMPDIMGRAGACLVEVGTTNRTHTRDYEDAITPRTGVIMKVHTSNYRIEGFTAEVPGPQLARIATRSAVPLLNDLGAGSLVDLSRWGLRREPTVAEAVADGADLVTFSGDKLLGGPQAGFIVGRRDLIARINRNPLKRALRLDKIRIAAMQATLRLYRDPDRLMERLPVLRFLARPQSEIAAQAQRLAPQVAVLLAPLGYEAEVCACSSQIGSGALPVDTIASAGLRLTGAGGDAPDRLSARLRALPRPVIGHIHDGAMVLDLRCLEDDDTLLTALAAL
ncbi:MAG: L-seryl-tRNA(Sec) selenium transferase [Paracoccus sp. (in: a-proteobacteria)]|uniref:L-seryl-tRNA(Sec) selenium transferase n=1 Tax=unclassified Paracoccus (in: a-proteobacteria) TaxID=2688777 RepID=UPI000C4690D0|nr:MULTISPECIES: L-seryl-tRNA(Sec) selenium transferase [unclassified Paracoccus (in: a-proteobacteria)]MAN55916.1 L-seryl-tRNA(Sec) selenium transferase [Paracoccus sp. (in: a-proteobacteria)]MBA48165.1 L-seryl-tRNA(Sec) selenium transferase [Paracoccus sp. (in: a-proteobacteria)]